MTFGFIQAEKASFPISQMCRVLGVSQSGIFALQDRPAFRRQQQDIVDLAPNRTAFALSNGTYGSPRMHRDLVDEGYEIGRHRTARLMRADVGSLDHLAAGLRKECLVTVCEREAGEPRH
jgi:putative transposase